MKITLKSTFSIPLFGIMVLTILLSGCTTVKKPQVAVKVYQDEILRQKALETLTSWRINGKLVFKSPQKKFSASLYWQQKARYSDIRLTAFLGTSIMKMQSFADHSTLEADGKVYHSNSPEQLLYQTTGITLPVNELPDWMKGASKDYQQHQLEFDALHRIKRIKLRDSSNQMWQIDYLEYTHVEQYQLPKKIRLTGGDINALIKISQWELNPSD